MAAGDELLAARHRRCSKFRVRRHARRNGERVNGRAHRRSLIQTISATVRPVSPWLHPTGDGGPVRDGGSRTKRDRYGRDLAGQATPHHRRVHDLLSCAMKASPSTEGFLRFVAAALFASTTALSSGLLSHADATSPLARRCPAEAILTIHHKNPILRDPRADAKAER